MKCLIPFTLMNVQERGRVYSCCPTWSREGAIGELGSVHDVETIWNSDKIVKIRECILADRLEEVCDSKYCPYAIKNQEIDLDNYLPDDPNLRKVIAQIRAGHSVLEGGPVHFEISHSGRCNLRCIMCESNESIVKENPELNTLIYGELVPRILPTVSEIVLTGNGEPFFIKDARELLQEFDPSMYPHVKFCFMTNGQLLTPEMWQSIKHNQFGWISVSIDAASKETYEYVRRGGNWEVLLDNLRLIAKLRQQNVFRYFAITFVVMRSNYREMISFAEKGLELGCDEIKFQKIFGSEAGSENIFASRDEKSLSEIREILEHPVFSHRQVDTSIIVIGGER